MNGYIDSDDYMAIKADCEMKINNLGEELHQTYLLKTKEDYDLIQNVHIFNDLKSFYADDNIELTNKRELSALLLKEKLVFDPADFGNNLNDATRMVYGFSSNEPMADNAKEQTTAGTISPYLPDRVHDYLTEFAMITATVKPMNENKIASY